MKKILFCLFVLALSSAYAQKKLNDEEKTARYLNRMTEAVSLTSDQVSKITPLVSENLKKQKDLSVQMNKQDGAVRMQSLQEEMKKNSQELDAAVGAVITKQQLIKLQAFYSTDYMDDLTEELELTPDQVKKITPLVNDANAKKAEIFKKADISGADTDKIVAEANKITDELDAQIGARISKQQLLKLQTYWIRRR